MRIVDALVEVLKDNESLTYKEAHLKIKERNYTNLGQRIQRQQSMQNYVVIVKD